jgi:uncharacterized protein YjdB
VFGSCKDVVAPLPVSSVALSSAALDLVPGESARLTAVARDDAGDVLERTVTWTSSDPSIVTVDNGLVTAIAAGNATVTATSEGKSATASVRIDEGGLLSPAGGTIHAIGGIVELDVPAAAVVSQSRLLVRPATQYPASPRIVKGTVFELSTSSGSSFAQPAMLTLRYAPADLGGKPESTVTLFGVVGSSWQQIQSSTVNTANHTVAARVSGLGVYAVFVEAGVASVAVNPANTTLVAGQSTKLSAVTSDGDGVPLTGRAVTWATSSESIAKIDASTGDVTAVAPGTATITATSENVSGTGTIRVTAGPAAKIRLYDGDGQTAAASAAVAISPSVIVTDASGFPVSGASVTFTVTAGGGSVSGATVATDDAGIARVGGWTLGASSGVNTLSATASGLDGSPVVFTATAQKSSTVTGDPVPPPPPSNPPASISIFAGDQQTAPPNTAVAIAPAVKVSDAGGVGVAGISVIFSIRSGGGSITGAVAVSDSKGIATVGSWILGAGGGNSLFATLDGVSGSPLIFVATANATTSPPPGPPPPPPPPPPPSCTPGTPASISINAGDGQTAVAGFAVPVPPSVKITNTAGQAACGVTVTFSIRSGEGSVTGASAISNESGIATVGSWTLGSIGGNSLFATLNGVSGSPIIFVASASAPAGSSVRIVTFGDSNTDVGWAGTNPNPVIFSYISSSDPRMSPNGGNSPYQLAGKIEARWSAQSAKPITAVNHAISATSTGAGRTPRGAPNAREYVNGVSRFEGEVMGTAYPWSGGEPANSFYAGPIARVRSYSPGATDFVYVSMGTNDPGASIPASMTAGNLEWMIDVWVNSGHGADHFILTTLAPVNGAGTAIQQINTQIRSLAARRGVRLVDIAARTSDDNGLTWRSSADNLDGVHYSEAVRDWIADQVVSIMRALVPN